MKPWLVCSCVLLLSIATGKAQNFEKEIAIQSILASPCISFVNDLRAKVVISRTMLDDLAYERPTVLGLDRVQAKLASERARALLLTVRAGRDASGCETASFPDCSESLYLILALIEAGEVSVLAPGSRTHEKTIFYTGTHCDDRYPAGFASIWTKDGTPIILMLPTCSV